MGHFLFQINIEKMATPPTAPNKMFDITGFKREKMEKDPNKPYIGIGEHSGLGLKHENYFKFLNDKN